MILFPELCFTEVFDDASHGDRVANFDLVRLAVTPEVGKPRSRPGAPMSFAVLVVVVSAFESRVGVIVWVAGPPIKMKVIALA